MLRGFYKGNRFFRNILKLRVHSEQSLNLDNLLVAGNNR